MIAAGDTIRVTAPHLAAYHGNEFTVTWVGTYGMGAENPIAHFFAKPDAATVEKKRGSFVYATEYEKV